MKMTQSSYFLNLLPQFGLSNRKLSKNQKVLASFENQEMAIVVIDDSDFSSSELSLLLGSLKAPPGKVLKIAIVTSKWKDLPYLNSLKEDRVSWILPSPLNEAKTEIFLKSIVKAPDELEIPIALLEKYESTILKRIETLSTLIQSLQQQFSEETLKELKGEVHKISGNAAPYGFAEAGTLCHNFEFYLNSIEEETNKQKLIENLSTFNENCDQFLEKLFFAFQHVV